MVGMKKAFFIVGKAKGKKFFVRKPFPTRAAGEKEIREARMRFKLKAKQIRESGRKVVPARITQLRVIQRPKFGFRRKR